MTSTTRPLPSWLDGKVSGSTVRVRLHPFNDADQVLAAYISDWFLATLGLKAIYSFHSGPVNANELGIDTGGGKFDGHRKGKSAAMLVAEATGFFVACPWARYLVEVAASRYDGGDKISVRLHRDLQTISRLMRIFHDKLLLAGKSEEQASEEVLRYGLIQIDLLFAGEDFRYRANGYRIGISDAVNVVEIPQQGRVVTMVAPTWAQVDIAELARSIHNPRVMISVSSRNRQVSILSRKDELDLTPIAVALRAAELKKRGQDPNRFDLTVEGQTIGFWHLSDGRWLVACGTRKHPAIGDFRTRLTVAEIEAIVVENLHLCQIRPGKEKKQKTEVPAATEEN